MKLIDCLLEVLPSHGGWKPGADFVAVSFGEAKFYSEKGGWLSTIEGVVDGMEGMKVNREEYELALAKSNRPAWSGEGLPPVGCECELFDCENWNPVIIKFVGDKYVVTERTDLGYEVVYCVAGRPERFRPIRIETERKREDACDQIYAVMRNAKRKDNRSDMAESVYDAIAAGKIPHITLK